VDAAKSDLVRGRVDAADFSATTPSSSNSSEQLQQQ